MRWLLWLLAGCYQPAIGDGAFGCGEAGRCPAGFLCASDKVCRRHDVGPFVGSGALGELALSAAVPTTYTLDTETGRIAVPGGAEALPARADGFEVIALAGRPAMALWSFRRLSVGPQVTLRPSPNSVNAACVLAASEEMLVEGVIDWSGFGGVGGDARRDASERLGSAGAGRHGGADGGGGGGGHADRGQDGTGNDVTDGRGGDAYKDDLSLLRGGGGGGGGGGDHGGVGGNGGGALALFAASLTLSGTLRASGSDARPLAAVTQSGGGGGGAGGSILVSASVMVLDGAVIEAVGGLGQAGTAGGGSGGAGAAGRIWLGSPSLNGVYSSEPSGHVESAPVPGSLAAAP